MISAMPKHSQTHSVLYSPEQMFDLVADIERYPDFLPWCEALYIRSRKGDEVIADMVIGFKIFHERFTSKVTLTHPSRIEVKHLSGPFKYLTNSWVFEASANGGCTINFDLDFQFRSKILEKAIGAVFHEAAQRMVKTFLARAKQLYG